MTLFFIYKNGKNELTKIALAGRRANVCRNVILFWVAKGSNKNVKNKILTFLALPEKNADLVQKSLFLIKNLAARGENFFEWLFVMCIKKIKLKCVKRNFYFPCFAKKKL
jgi:hypothetical protein